MDKTNDGIVKIISLLLQKFSYVYKIRRGVWENFLCRFKTRKAQSSFVALALYVFWSDTSCLLCGAHLRLLAPLAT